MNSRSLLSASFLVLATVFAAGCAGSTSSGDPTTGDDSNVTSSKKLGTEGGMCGGLAGIRCGTGLECKIADTGSSDPAGTCVKSDPGVDEGGTCAGIAGLTCKSGLTCVKEQANVADASGTCQKASPSAGEEGGMCGGIAGLPCKSGLSCVKEANAIDAAGVCQKK
jgi:hypothetical protein